MMHTHAGQTATKIFFMKHIIAIIALLVLACSHVSADKYTVLWKQYETATRKDLPKDAEKVLGRIISQARSERAYGHWLKAELRRMEVRRMVSPDSAAADIARLKSLQRQHTEVAFRAVTDVLIGSLYGQDSSQYFRQALEHMAVLADTPARGYEPLLEEEKASSVFGNDLLHVLGLHILQTTQDRKYADMLHDFYEARGNRAAACMAAVEGIRTYWETNDADADKAATQTDKLLLRYADLPEAGEAAILRYEIMQSQSNVSHREKYEFLTSALEKWGKWYRSNELRNDLAQLTLPRFDLRTLNSQLPNRPFMLHLSNITHIDRLEVTLTGLNLRGDTKLSTDNTEDLKKIIAAKNGGPVFRAVRTYADSPIYKPLTDSIEAPALKPGMYLIEARSDNGAKMQPELLHVSDVYVIRYSMPDGTMRFLAVSGTTGAPLPGAALRLSFGRSSKTITLKTDREGKADYRFTKDAAGRSFDLFAEHGTDAYMCPTDDYPMGNYYNDDSRSIANHLFTDRAIYRPGQTVHATVLSYNEQQAEAHAAEGRKIKLELRDANWKMLRDTVVTTDEYGMGYAAFQLPKNGLTGTFAIRCEAATQYFQVEEYKRPTFEVTFDTLDTAYRIGDTVQVRGRAMSFAGVPVADAEVKIRVNRNLSFLRHYFTYSDERTHRLLTDTCRTDAEGRFVVNVPLTVPDDTQRKWLVWTFTTEADVTNGAGESQSGTYALPLSRKSQFLSIELPERLRKENFRTLEFKLENYAGKPLQQKVTYRLEGTLETFTATTNQAVEIPKSWRKLKSGKYSIVALCGTDTATHSFTLFSMDDTRPAAVTDEWFWSSTDRFPRDGQPVYVQVGSSDKEVHMYYLFISGKKILESGWLTQSNFVKTYKISYKPEYKEGLQMVFAWVKDGKTHRLTHKIERPEPNKEIKWQWRTFRDKVQPGATEEWTLQLTAPDSKNDIFFASDHKNDLPTGMRLMAVLYDKSLDMFTPHSWQLTPNVRRSSWYMDCTMDEPFDLEMDGVGNYKALKSENLLFSHLDASVRRLNNFMLYGSRVGDADVLYAVEAMSDNVVKREVKIRGANSLGKTSFSKKKFTAPVIKKDSDTKDAVADSTEEAEVLSQAPRPTLRRNFHETAFFYPSLTADKEGVVRISFRLPESVTTWKFLGLAHDKNMNTGTITAATVAQKALMLQPNMPRFLREGDRSVFKATISNTTDTAYTGTATFEIVEPGMDKVLLRSQQTFQLQDRHAAPTVVSFDLPQTATLKAGLYIVRMMAETGQGADGEQHYLPILSNKELVQNSIAFTQDRRTYKIDISRILPTKGNITIEYAANPAWMMLQSLHYLAQPNERNAISLATAVYANGIGTWIVRSNPEIRTVMSQWSKEQTVSPLQDNEELKNLDLSDTPWLNDALQETAQQKQLSSFFDMETLNRHAEEQIRALEKLQNTDGSLSWWQGMGGNVYTTTIVAVNLARMQYMTGTDTGRKILDKAYKYLSGVTAKEVQELKKEEKKGHKDLQPSEMACNYLYISSLLDKNSADIMYLVNLLAKVPTKLTIYGKSMSSLILRHYGKIQLAETYARSVDQYTVFQPELGRYFDTPKAEYSWRSYRIPSQTAAIEALQASVAPKHHVEEMQRWLLQEKRTQQWDSPISTADAVYAFLHGSGVLQSRADAVIRTNDSIISRNKAEMGLGYQKVTLKEAQPSTITFEKQNDAMSWGAIYAQFQQETADIDALSSGISLQRELLSEDNSPLKGTLHIGQRVKIRITVQTSRDMDFVQVVDKRPACFQPVNQLSEYRNGYYSTPKDNQTNFYFDKMPKGKHVIETYYYVDRAGTYLSGTCTAQCAYSPAFTSRTKALNITVE